MKGGESGLGNIIQGKKEEGGSIIVSGPDRQKGGFYCSGGEERKSQKSYASTQQRGRRSLERKCLLERWGKVVENHWRGRKGKDMRPDTEGGGKRNSYFTRQRGQKNVAMKGTGRPGVKGWGEKREKPPISTVQRENALAKEKKAGHHGDRHGRGVHQ